VLGSAYKHIKSHIPNKWKYPLWYIFYAPQRDISGGSLLRDLQGIAIYLFRKIFAKKHLQPITICTGISNRSAQYLQHVVESLQHIQHQNLITLSVFDCNSDDVQNLETEIRKYWKGELVYQKQPIAFSRAHSFNQAIAQAPTSIVFASDADMSLPTDLVHLCNQYTGKKIVWFPICFYLFKNKPANIDPQNGVWEQYGGKGMFAAHKSGFEKVGQYDEQYTTWGQEDTDLWERFHKNAYIIIRNRQPGLMHHWHHTLNPKYRHMNDA
jgi:hypothetical protein